MLLSSFGCPRRLLVGVLALLALLSAPGCSTQKRLARAAGMKSATLKLADLGPSYQEFKDTEHDYFSAKPAVVRLTGRKPIKVKFYTFKVKPFDAVTKEVNALYGQYRFLDAVSMELAEGISYLMSKELFDISAQELTAAVRRNDKERVTQIRKLKRLYEASRLLVTSATPMADSVKGLQEATLKLDKVVESVKADPTKTVMAPQMLEESKRSAGRLMEVVKGLPKIAARVSKVKDLGKLGTQYERLKGLVK